MHARRWRELVCWYLDRDLTCAAWSIVNECRVCQRTRGSLCFFWIPMWASLRVAWCAFFKRDPTQFGDAQPLDCTRHGSQRQRTVLLLLVKWRNTSGATRDRPCCIETTHNTSNPGLQTTRPSSREVDGERKYRNKPRTYVSIDGFISVAYLSTRFHSQRHLTKKKLPSTILFRFLTPLLTA